MRASRPRGRQLGRGGARARRLRRLLAEDMGLGKTVQTIAHILAQKASGGLGSPVLIVAPTSVLPNWQAEIGRFTPELSVLLLHGPDRHDRHDGIATHEIVLTSYPLLVRDEARLAGETFGLIVGRAGPRPLRLSAGAVRTLEDRGGGADER